MGEPGVILRAWRSSSLPSAPYPSCLRTLWALSITALGWLVSCQGIFLFPEHSRPLLPSDSLGFVAGVVWGVSC